LGFRQSQPRPAMSRPTAFLFKTVRVLDVLLAAVVVVAFS
jgi:hypothetical protein